MFVTEEQTNTVAHLTGSLDAASAAGVREGLMLLSQVGTTSGWIVLDISSVSLLDWQGAHLLAALSRRSYAAGTRFRLRAPAHHLRAIAAAAAARPFLLA